MALLAEHRVLTAEQLGRLTFPNPHRARHRLLLLTERDILRRFRTLGRGPQPWRYAIGHLGALIHAADTGEPFPRPSETSTRIARLQSSATIDHLLGVNEFFSRLAETTRSHPQTALTEWWPEPRIAAACDGIVRPDGYGKWAEGSASVGFFLEHDTGTEPLTTLIEKVGKYQRLARAGLARPVLFHLINPTREQRLLALIARTPPDPTCPAVAVATTAVTHYGQHTSPAERIWTLATTTPGTRPTNGRDRRPGSHQGPHQSGPGRGPRRRLIELADSANSTDTINPADAHVREHER